MRQTLHPHFTAWHITWGTYGARLHGCAAATVDREHNKRGEPFIYRDAERQRAEQSLLKFPVRIITPEQRLFAEQRIPHICVRGGWEYRTCAAASDHIHMLCDVRREIHGEKVRRLLKRWLGEELSKRWPTVVGQTWWAEEGSNIAIHDEHYLNNAFNYIVRQRATPPE